MRDRVLLALPIVLIWASPASGAAPAAGDRGAHITVQLTGSEMEAPRQTSTTDIDLFSGLGLAVAAGYRTGRFRVEGELHLHHNERAYSGDTLDLRAFMVNAYTDFNPWKGLALFAGAGIGTARARVDFGTCLEPSGCSISPVTVVTEQGIAYQYVVGVGWLFSKDRLMFLSYRGFRTEDLGIRNVDGIPYSDGRVDMPMAVFGYSWRF